MSGGGGNRKKATRSQGWEEAGSEFYQESYPVNAEIEVLQRDPKHLATLLPSKQTRAAATIRVRTNDSRNNRTMRRHTASRSRRESTVHRRTSNVSDVQVSMLPDLSEMRTNEETAWEEVMEIKSMPIPMAQKKERKAKILHEPVRLQGYEEFKWKRRKMWGQFQTRLKESVQKMELWRGALKHIEGNYGTGVVAFFLFLKWLFVLNLITFLFIFLFVTLPVVLLDWDKVTDCTETNFTACCSEKYFNSSLSDSNIALDLVQGTGVLERTVLFYGFYSDSILAYKTGGITMYYDLPLAYILITILYLLLSLCAILRSSAKGFKERLVEGEGQFYQYCNMVFGGWDFCIHNEKSAKMKHQAIYSEIKAALETEKLEEERQSRTRNEWYKIIFSRVIVNIIVLAILAGSGCGIFLVFTYSNEQLQSFITNSTSTGGESFQQLLFEFLPAITIVCLNLIVPFLFKLLIGFEKYTPMFVVRFTLIRTVFLRLASLIVLYASLLTQISCDVEDGDLSCTNCDNVPVCWETFVGQQIYKLLLTDLGVHIVLTFVINFARSLLASHVNNKFFAFIGEQTFDLPKHALDIVYTQTLCWFGMFYAPLLSLMATVIFFLLFYIKKFACLINCRPSTVIYRASRSNSLFMVVLLVSYVVAVLPIAYSVSELVPSKSCGPFQNKESVWSLIVDTFMQAPMWIQNIIFFVSTAGFAIPVFIVLLLLLYYYTAVNSANRHMVTVLKNQLVLEGHDKQFLLDRLSLFIRQEGQKRDRGS
ncbi:hypothetical protein NQ315_004386 [Exocentrus adspersus]|uniref:TMC domain-containing protein n=1 Tax=Exocentrus adspersus TaxID=1586481 RepID=A0AAV8W7U7_9CUCU|nr:hypothetical protein NQ315_004386 [Exocentrus adspersus]